MFTHCSFDTTTTTTKLDYHRDKNCTKNFCEDLKKHATKTINYEKKEMIPFTNKEKNYIVIKKCVIYAKKRDLVLMMTMKNIIKSEIVVITQENIEEQLMIFAI